MLGACSGLESDVFELLHKGLSFSFGSGWKHREPVGNLVADSLANVVARHLLDGVGLNLSIDLGDAFHGSLTGVPLLLNWHLSCKVDALGVSPVDIAAVNAETILVDVGLHSRKLSGNNVLYCCVYLGLNSLSCITSGGTVSIIKSEHKVVGPSIHLNWEDSCLVWQSFKTHLINPGLEVEAFNWWNGVVLLLFGDFIVVLAWWVNSEHHCLCAQNGSVVPRRLQERLSNVVDFVKESLGFFNVSEAELVTNHVLLSNTKGSHVVELLRFVVGIFCQSQSFCWSVRSLGADLEYIFHVLSIAGHLVV